MFYPEKIQLGYYQLVLGNLYAINWQAFFNQHQVLLFLRLYL